MPVHDWAGIEAGAFHALHGTWITTLVQALNHGVLPPGYRARPEHILSGLHPDLLTLRLAAAPDPAGGAGLATAPHGFTRVRPDPARRPRRRRAVSRNVVVRQASGRQVVAIIEIVSASNKDRAASVRRLAEKVVSCIEGGVHALLIDILPRTAYDPAGVHGAVWATYDTAPFVPPAGGPLLLTSYLGRPGDPEAYLGPCAPGQVLPPMPLFLTAGRWVHVPLEETYQAAIDILGDDFRAEIEAGAG